MADLFLSHLQHQRRVLYDGLAPSPRHLPRPSADHSQLCKDNLSPVVYFSHCLFWHLIVSEPIPIRPSLLLVFITCSRAHYLPCGLHFT